MSFCYMIFEIHNGVKITPEPYTQNAHKVSAGLGASDEHSQHGPTYKKRVRIHQSVGRMYSDCSRYRRYESNRRMV
jgi:hypothetical protein